MTTETLCRQLVDAHTLAALGDDTEITPPG
jgi:hypothetical protein